MNREISNEMMEKWVESIKDKSIADIIRLFKEKREELDRITDEKSYCQKQYDFLRMNLIPDKMDDEGKSTITAEYEDGERIRVTLTSDIFVYITVKNQRKVINWLLNIVEGNLVEDVINETKLKTLIKERMKEGKRIPEDIIKVTPITKTSLTNLTKAK